MAWLTTSGVAILVTSLINRTLPIIRYLVRV